MGIPLGSHRRDESPLGEVVLEATTREEGLALYVPRAVTYDTHHATGTDGKRWFRTAWALGQDAHWSREILWNGRFFYWAEAETDPPGVDWVPGTFDPTEGTLPVSDPAVEIPKASGRQCLPRGMKPPPPQGNEEPCQCEACRRRRGEDT